MIVYKAFFLLLAQMLKQNTHEKNAKKEKKVRRKERKKKEKKNGKTRATRIEHNAQYLTLTPFLGLNIFKERERERESLLLF